MRQKYLGDSYDIVKRFWAVSLRSIAQLYAHSRFVPHEIRVPYTLVTTIPILDTPPRTPFGILLDPHTGIPLPTESTEHATAQHAPLSFIVKLNEELGPEYLICFDQSYHRGHNLTREEQREKKREYLWDHELNSFYYVSHAPFLFVSRSPEVLDAIRAKLSSLGMPPHRLKPGENQCWGIMEKRKEAEMAGDGRETNAHPHIEIPEVADTLPRCDWVYFATTARWSGTVTADFVAEQKIIVRSVHNAHHHRIANVQHLMPGQRILLVHGGPGKPYRALFSGTIAAAASPVRTSQHCFEAFSYIDESLNEQLKAGGYDPDPVVGRFTGISITAVRDLRNINSVIPRPAGSPNTIWRWDKVFGR